MVLQRASSRLRASRVSCCSDSATPVLNSMAEDSQRRMLRENGSAARPEASLVLMASQSLLAEIDAVLAVPLPVPVCFAHMCSQGPVRTTTVVIFADAFSWPPTAGRLCDGSWYVARNLHRSC